MEHIKPKLEFEEQYEKLKDLGITRGSMEKKEVMNVLKNSNYYFKIAAFRKNFPKNSQGKYNIEFKHLQDLATLDMRLRYVLLSYCLDIEHSLKTFLLRIITNDKEEDGYRIVQEVISRQNNPEEFKKSLFKSVMYEKNGETKFTSGFEKYYADPPLWVVLEISSIGKIKYFVEYLSEKRPNNKILSRMNANFNYFNTIRNCCAHNKPIIFNLPTYGSIEQSIYTKAVQAGVPSVQMKMLRIAQIYAVLNLHSLICSPGLKTHRYDEFCEFVTRFNSTKNYYSSNNNIKLLNSAMNVFVDIFKPS